MCKSYWTVSPRESTLCCMERDADKVIVIGAGMGGLAAATGLASAGLDVTVIEAASGPGGKMRTVASAAGPHW